MKLGLGVWMGLAAVAGVPGIAQAQDDDADTAEIAALCLTTDPSIPFEALPRAEQLALIACVQREAAARIKSTLPIKVDDLTSVTDITANGTILTYHNRVDVLRAQVPPDAIGSVVDSTREFVCAEPNMTATIRNGGGYRYRWTDRDGDYIAETTIESC